MKRVWLNGRDVQKRLEKEENLRNIKVLPGFYGTTPSEQCQMFYDSDIIVGPHGAHMANTVCSRAGTLFVEMCCADFGWTGRAQETYLEPMGFKYVAPTLQSTPNFGVCEKSPNFKGGTEKGKYASFHVNYTLIRDLIQQHQKQGN